jgi:TP901 family phage tail tape measure protein
MNKDTFEMNFLFKATTDKAGVSLKKLSGEFQALRKEVVMTYARMDVPLNKAGFGNILGIGGGRAGSIGSAAQPSMSALGQRLKSMAAPAAGAFALGEMINKSMDFEKVMGRIASRIPNDETKLRSLSEALKDMSSETGRPLDELGRGMFELVNDFKDASTPELMARLKAGMKLSKVAFSDTAESVDYLSRMTSIFGESTPESMEKVAAKTFSAMKKSDVSLEEFSSTMNGLAPDAKMLGISMDEMFSIFSTFSDGRVQFDRLGGGLQLMLRNMVQAKAGTGALGIALQSMGYDTGKAFLSQNGFAGAMEKLTYYSKTNRVSMEDLVGTGKGLFLAMRMGAKGMKELRENTRGGNKDMQDMEQTINAINKATQTTRSLEKLKTTATTSATSIGGIFAPLLSKALGAINVPLTYLNKKMEMSQLITTGREEYETKWQKSQGKGMDYRAYFNTTEGREFLLKNSSSSREAWNFINEFEGRTKPASEQVIKMLFSLDEEGNVNVNPKAGNAKTKINFGTGRPKDI